MFGIQTIPNATLRALSSMFESMSRCTCVETNGHTHIINWTELEIFSCRSSPRGIALLSVMCPQCLGACDSHLPHKAF